jgi:hypothetical protein
VLAELGTITQLIIDPCTPNHRQPYTETEPGLRPEFNAMVATPLTEDLPPLSSRHERSDMTASTAGECGEMVPSF